MNIQMIDKMRQVDGLFAQLLDLPPHARAAQLAKFERDVPEHAPELRRLLTTSTGEYKLHAAGALDGSIAQECLLGLAIDPPLAVGAEIGPYRIEALLGRGGMANVYRASRHFDGFVQHVALKLMRSDKLDQQFRTRLLLEQRALVRLDHPNIARFLDAGLALDGACCSAAAVGGDAYLAMELVEGTPITSHANSSRADLRERVRWMADLCKALSHAHAHLIIHCDIKPSNVLVDRDGRLRLLDFGIARIVEDAGDRDGVGAGARLFTPDCAAPEQVTGAPATTAIDIFQVGALLYRLIVGKPWLSSVESLSKDNMDAIAQELPMAPSQRLRRECGDHMVQENVVACGFYAPNALARKVSGGLDAVVLKCLAKDPIDRYHSIEQLGVDLQRWLEQRPIAGAATGRRERFTLWARRNLRMD